MSNKMDKKTKRGTKLSYRIKRYCDSKIEKSENSMMRLGFRLILFLYRLCFFGWNCAVWGIVLLCIGFFLISRTSIYQHFAEAAYDSLASMNEGTFRQYSNTIFLDQDDNVIGEVNSGNYEYTKMADIPMNLQNAYIAAEDQSFKTHQGVDYKATARAALSLVIHRGKITQGGSTITQQVIKNNLLTQEQTFTRKFLEILIAPQLEKNYSKAEIMEFYCNSNYYGNGCYGVASAALFYFGKAPQELTLAECAMIAGISNSPNNYNPVASMELAVHKQKSILGKMLEQGYISEEQYETALAQEIIVTQTETSLVSTANYMCTYAMYCSVLELMEIHGFHFQYVFDDLDDYQTYKSSYEETYKKYASEIRSGGYTIKTTFSLEVQNILQACIDQGLSGFQDLQDNGKYAMQGAAVCIDNRTDCVVAIVGGRGSNDEYNRAFLSTRQPGSCIKPLLVYAPALDLGIVQPSSLYIDQQVFAVDGDKDSYSPQNANGRYLGSMSIREAVARSTNTVAFQVFQEVGIPRGLGYLGDLKFSSLHASDYASQSLALGGFTNGTRVVDMAKGYATLEHAGQYTGKTCLRSISHETLGTVYDYVNEKTEQIYSQDTAFIMSDILQGVFREAYGTAHQLTFDQIAAGKTGTTNSNRDAWFCGYTGYYTTAVWVGRDDNGTVKDMTGSSYPAKIWVQFMENIHGGLEPLDFTVPETIEYHNITENGDLGDEIYSKDTLNESLCVYDRRPSGYDYLSLQAQAAKEQSDNEKWMKKTMNEAEKAVSEFESYEIYSIDTALSLDPVYAEVLEKIYAIPDEYVQSGYLERAADKYQTLSGELIFIWKKLIKEKEEEDRKQISYQNEIIAEEQIEEAYDILHQRRLTYMDWYIARLEERKYNTDTTHRLLNDARRYLSNLSGYQEYDYYADRIDELASSISRLPTRIPSPTVPENSMDVMPDEEEYEEPDQTVITPTPSVITPTPSVITPEPDLPPAE